jgi:hypothetical protein
MSKVVIDVREGVIVMYVDGDKRVIDRGETGMIIFDPMDNPEAEKPDPDMVTWTPFEEYEMDRPDTDGWRMYQNNVYTVLREELDGGLTHLSIRRNDRHWARDWRHFQRIKNEILGPEREAMELYPAESRLVDEANQFHLWCPPEGHQISAGYETPDVHGPMLGSGSRQRPFS